MSYYNMSYYKLNGRPALDSLFDDSDSAGATPFQQGVGNTPAFGSGEISDPSSAVSTGTVAVAPAAGLPAEGFGLATAGGPSTPTNQNSTNWSGGVLMAGSGESFSTVSAQWVIPTISQVPGVTTSDVAEWVGIDGDQSSDVCQAGVYQEAQTSNGQTTVSCQAWVEWYPADAEFIPLSSFDVSPGNTISVTVETSGKGATEATFILDDETTGQTYETSLAAPKGTSLQGNTAEAIVETPDLISGNGQMSQPPLADFLNSPVAFDDVSATYSNGSAASLSSAQSFGMLTNNNDPPGVTGSVQEAYGTIQPGSDSIAVTEDDYWGGPATTAEMIMTDSSGNYYIYDIGNNSLLGSTSLGNLGSGYTFGGIGNFGGDRGDIMLENESTGQFEVYDISNNQITGSSEIALTGSSWTVAGLGDFSGNANETDMIARNSNTGAFEVYDISNNQVTGTNELAVVGSNWSVAGFGDFSTNPNETDMVLYNSGNGDYLAYDISDNHYTSDEVIAQVGSNWAVAGFGDFSGNVDETDMLLRNTSSGAFELYDIKDNQVTDATEVAVVGLEWTVAGFGDFSGVAGETDMLLRNTTSGAFEVYDFADGSVYNAQSAGQVATDLSVSGAGPDVGPSDMELSASANGASESSSATMASQPVSTDAGGDDPQMMSIGNSSGTVPSPDSFAQSPAWAGPVTATQAWYNTGSQAYSAAGGSQQQSGQVGDSFGVGPMMSSFSAPLSGADLFGGLLGANDATSLLAASIHQTA